MAKSNKDLAEQRLARGKEKLIEQFKKMPIIQIAVERAGFARATYYRWLEEDPVFRDAAMAAIGDGEAFLSDKSEAQLVTLIGEKHFGAIKHYLTHHSEKYAAGKGLGGRPDRKIRVVILHDYED